MASYCKRGNIRFIIDIQDLWPEAFQMVFHVPVLGNLIFAPFRHLANKAYEAADEIIAVSQTYVDRALSANSKSSTGHSVFLGTKLETFDTYARENLETEKREDEIWIGYCGTLGASYDITCVIDALSILKKDFDGKVKFVVMGDGPRKQEFENYAKAKDINAVFTGRLPYPIMCGKLVACDIVVNPITKGAAQSIINKHADYAASGLPVINTQECPEYRELVEKYEMGFNCKNNDSKDLAEKLLMLLDDSELRTKMGKNARKCAVERFDRKVSYQTIMDRILNG